MRRSAIVVSLLAILALAAPAYAAFPGANGKIAWSFGTINPDGTEKTPLHGPTSVDDYPTVNRLPDWSPDGTKIAFESICDDEEACGGRSDIFVINADGSGLTRLTTSFAFYNAGASWSPDGSKIVFTSFRGGPQSLWVMNSDGSDQHSLNVAGYVPDWSPDGSKIVYTYYQGAIGGANDIYTVSPDGSGQTNLTNSSGTEFSPDWSPDGRKIVFTRYHTYVDPVTGITFAEPDIFTMNADGSAQTNLTNNINSSDDYPVWSPDGKKIAWSRTFADSTFHSDELFTMNADGSDPVGTGTCCLTFLDWQPLPGPQRSDFKNAAQFCKAKRAFMGESAFGRTYGTSGNGANAFGKCVSGDGR